MQIRELATASLVTAMLSTVAHANEGAVPAGVPHLDHVFVIMMENHGYSQILDNPNAPFINQLANSANSATNYFAIGHPSLTNYLEVVGGSNFGVQSDNDPGLAQRELHHQPRLRDAVDRQPAEPIICPIAGHRHGRGDPGRRHHERDPGSRRERTTSTGSSRFRPRRTRPARPSPTSWSPRARAGRATRRACRSSGADLVNYSDGFFTDNTDFSTIMPALEPAALAGRRRQALRRQAQPVRVLPQRAGGQRARATACANVVGFEGPQRPVCRPRLRHACRRSRSSRPTSATTSTAAATRERSATSTPPTTARRPASTRR